MVKWLKSKRQSEKIVKKGGGAMVIIGVLVFLLVITALFIEWVDWFAVEADDNGNLLRLPNGKLSTKFNKKIHSW